MITKHFFKYFRDRRRSSSGYSQIGDLEMILGLVIEEDNVVLSAPRTKREIEEVIKSMLLDKAPGPDGPLAEFYQRY